MLHHPLSEGLDVLLSFVHQWLALVVRLVEQDGGEVVDLEALDLVQRSVHLGNRHAADLVETLAELCIIILKAVFQTGNWKPSPAIGAFEMVRVSE